MDEEWIEATITPALAGIADRQWTAESLGALVAELDGKIKAAVESGELSREGARRARERISAAMRTVPGVTSHRASEKATLHVTAKIKRRDE